MLLKTLLNKKKCCMHLFDAEARFSTSFQKNQEELKPEMIIMPNWELSTHGPTRLGSQEFATMSTKE
jgi:hypothetical protein